MAGQRREAVVSFVDVSHQRAAENAKEEAMLAVEKLGRARAESALEISE
jgi:hypothetical protein